MSFSSGIYNIPWNSSQPGKPHSEVDNDYRNSSKYQQNIVDEHTEVAAKGSIAKLSGSLKVSSIVVIGSLEEVTRYIYSVEEFSEHVDFGGCIMSKPHPKMHRVTERHKDSTL